MSFFEHWQFFACLIILLIPAVIMGALEKPLKHYTVIISLFFLFSIIGRTPVQLIYLILFFFIEWGILKGYLLLYQKHGRQDETYYLSLVVSLLPLIISKFQPFIKLDIFCFVGISYITFKIVQMIIEVYDGVIKNIKFYEYTAFLLFFPSFSSGPIDRSRRFLADWNRVLSRDAYLALCSSGILRLLIGFVYKTLIAGRCFHHLQKCTGIGIQNEVEYAYLYGIYLFFDFAGYSLMAMGAGNVLGIDVPANFNKPFISKDLKDFWDRWHISLSHWFRDFIFTRFVMKCKKKKWFGSKLQRANVGFIVNMGIMGIWHGLDISYIIYGLYHGMWLAITETYQKKSTFYKNNKAKKWYIVLSWFITMQIYFFGFYIFSGRMMQMITKYFAK